MGGRRDVKEGPVALERHPHSVEAINAWALASAYDAVVWTALASNFHEPGKGERAFLCRHRDPISRNTERPTLTLANALNDIRQTPAGVQPPRRAAVNARLLEG